MPITCTLCGHDYDRRRLECPQCGLVNPAPAGVRPHVAIGYEGAPAAAAAAPGPAPAIQVTRFEVSAHRHPDASATNLQWVVFARVQFASADPQNWGEFRAYGGSWYRTFNRGPHTARQVTHQDSAQLVGTYAGPALDMEDSALLVTQRHLPFWGHIEKPAALAREDVRLGNDQHVEIFYKRPVRGVPRSSRLRGIESGLPEEAKPFDIFGDEQGSDSVALAMMRAHEELPHGIQAIERPGEIRFGTHWHIIARDEPQWSGVGASDWVEYWHQAEFQVRRPGQAEVLASKRIFLRVRGSGADRVYDVYER